ncbi:MAG: SDR family NAD(P)-dependent oxidoreductase [Aquincola sp.]|nr:SDR family NAD(P)-dependent oxidoreductase [Aquincola sp.]MDH4289892.1 SDR family NAD(P)-dependent oxidoreductase [Aquincola sp.]MDH5329704.1 SDR family NAD(P)-dependent oxidoreductase [Aquincola sp.]
MTDPTCHLYIVTGASRGLGRAIATQLAASGATVLGLSRQAPPAEFEQWTCNLADPLPVAVRLGVWLGAFEPGRFSAAVLINNAAMLADPRPLADVDLEELSATTRVGLEAPLLLSAAFLRATRGWTGQRRVLHISSGLGRRAMASQGPYCAVKAGLDHLARAQALEEAQQPNGAKVCSLAPGVVDTDMQIQLRGADPQGFPDRDAFVQMKTSGRLDSPSTAAGKVIAYLTRADFGANPVADVRDP